MPNADNIAALERAIANHKAYMRGREISHGLYYVDPNGHKADSTQLNHLTNALAREQAA